MLVIRHVDALNARQVRELGAVLQRDPGGGQPDGCGGGDPGPVPRQRRSDRAGCGCSRHREAPPLRHHIEDVGELVPFFLAKLSSRAGLSCSPAASNCCCGQLAGQHRAACCRCCSRSSSCPGRPDHAQGPAAGMLDVSRRYCPRWSPSSGTRSSRHCWITTATRWARQGLGMSKRTITAAFTNTA